MFWQPWFPFKMLATFSSPSGTMLTTFVKVEGLNGCQSLFICLRELFTLDQNSVHFLCAFMAVLLENFFPHFLHPKSSSGVSVFSWACIWKGTNRFMYNICNNILSTHVIFCVKKSIWRQELLGTQCTLQFWSFVFSFHMVDKVYLHFKSFLHIWQ